MSIQVRSKSLLEWSLCGLSLGASAVRVILIVREEHDTGATIDAAAANLGFDLEVVQLGARTRGQTETALLGADIAGVHRQAPVAIWNIDTFLKSPSVPVPWGSNWLLLFPSDQINLSFAEVDPSGRVVRVAEKRVISPYATAGLYAFSSLETFNRAAHDSYPWLRGQQPAETEAYVAPIYNSVITKEPVTASIVSAQDVVPLGTPQEVNENSASLPVN